MTPSELVEYLLRMQNQSATLASVQIVWEDMTPLERIVMKMHEAAAMAYEDAWRHAIELDEVQR